MSQLDRALFKCLQSALSGCAPGSGGGTNEMLRVCLDDREVFQLLFRAAKDCASASMPEDVREAFMSATMTALQKTRRRSARHCHWRFFSHACRQNCGTPVREGSGIGMRPFPVRPFRARWHRLRRDPCIDGREPDCDCTVNRRCWCLRPRVPELRGLLPFVRAT